MPPIAILMTGPEMEFPGTVALGGTHLRRGWMGFVRAHLYLNIILPIYNKE